MSIKTIKRGLFIYTFIVLTTVMLATAALTVAGRADAQTSENAPTCPYQSTQARIRVPGGEWQQNLTITCGEFFQLGVFHNNDFSQLATDAAPLLYDGEGQALFPKNGVELMASSEYGTATYEFRTFTTGALLSDENCTDVAYLTCIPAVAATAADNDTADTGRVLGADSTAGVDVSKAVINPKDPFEVGQNIRYRITVTNNSDQTITELPMQDRFPSGAVALQRVIYGGGENITGSFDINNAQGTVSMSDLTLLFSDLEPGERIEFEMLFVATSSGQNVCNLIDIRYDRSRACVRIIERPPVTDL